MKLRSKSLPPTSNLPRQQLDELSVALARCLHPDYPPPAVAEPIAQLIRGPKELEKGIAKLIRAERSLSEALQHFSQVKMVDPHGRTGFENPFVVFRQDLRAARRKMRSVQQIYSKNIKRRTTIFDGVPDRRRVRDERRLAVCHSIFRFWEGTGSEAELHHQHEYERSGRPAGRLRQCRRALLDRSSRNHQRPHDF